MKRLIVTILITALILTAPMTLIAHPNIDTASPWAKESIREATTSETGFLSPRTAMLDRTVQYLLEEINDFKEPITRGEFTKILMQWVIYNTGTTAVNLNSRMGLPRFGEDDVSIGWFMGRNPEGDEMIRADRTNTFLDINAGVKGGTQGLYRICRTYLNQLLREYGVSNSMWLPGSGVTRLRYAPLDRVDNRLVNGQAVNTRFVPVNYTLSDMQEYRRADLLIMQAGHLGIVSGTHRMQNYQNLLVIGGQAGAGDYMGRTFGEISHFPRTNALNLQLTYFSPDRLVTREEAAAMVARAVNFVELMGTRYEEQPVRRTNLVPCPLGTGMLMSIPEPCFTQAEVHAHISQPSGAPNQNFADQHTISDWARDAVNFVGHRNIMGGVGDNRFGPHSNITIEQAIVTLNNIYVRGATEAAEVVPPAQTPVAPPTTATPTTRYVDFHVYENGQRIVNPRLGVYAPAHGKYIDNVPHIRARTVLNSFDIASGLSNEWLTIAEANAIFESHFNFAIEYRNGAIHVVR